MTMIALWLKIDEKHVVETLQEAGEKLDSAERKVVLDFSSVQRIDPRAVRKIEEFARLAGDKGVEVTLRGVKTEVYKVLKLLKLASLFSFTN